MLVYLVIGLRVAWMSFILYISGDGSEILSDSETKVILIFDMLASTGELLIGLTQAFSMAELYFLVKNIVEIFCLRDTEASISSDNNDVVRMTALENGAEKRKKLFRMMKYVLYFAMSAIICFTGTFIAIILTSR